MFTRLEVPFYQVGGPPPILLSRLDISEVSIQLGSSWEALAGKEEPGGKEEQRTGGDGRRGVSKRLALRRSPPFKNSRRGWDSLFCKKVKVEVSLFTFNFCCVNCCNTSQLLLLTGSRLLKLLLTTKCISTRIFVCLFVFIQLSLAAKNNSNIIML